MAKYSKKAGDKVERAMHEMHHGDLKSGRSGKKVTSRKQAIAIGLSEAREEGAKVPKKKSAAKKAAPKKAAAKKAAPRKSTASKPGPKKGATKKAATKRAGAKPGPKKGS
jgi:topoisomerase IA-like protein